MIIFNDGLGVDIAGRLLYSQGFPENLNGTDLTPAILSQLAPGTRIFLLGSTAEVLADALRSLSALFPHLNLCGSLHGFFQEDQNQPIADQIRKSAADLVLVGMGQPRQELWAVRHGVSTGATLLCIGAYLDFAAGRFSRAPAILRKLRLEWLFRLALEPRRLWRRYLVGNLTFLWHIILLRCRNLID
ncbi:WecB/TagA/CpsF family glycosyltransferase [Sphingomonas hankyongi]|uniref:WecB/TagA/CpsF family glycosyltransferase n=1 Tax=Sphingomonas hankyongi TaxID=2908209 RepID=A0ABT0S3F6_9SPHN|nr:WecB/TagA/CpsF family glycosyltransferase [Sphingomonas hankyongi]MCL6730131.1 WecB/TagA/CpsF family glycosyltransferase [Sphingomonas hankyongi]